jgi:polyisoprenoid-binding protein YceI
MAKVNWTVDATHSGIDFTVRHMMFAKVRGSFNAFEAQVEADPEDLTTANIRVAIDAASVDTNNDDRDGHLKSADFFDVENHAQIVFQSTSIKKLDENEYAVTGDVTLRGVTKSETFTVNFEGSGKDPWGNVKVGFSGSGAIKRSDYGLTWNAALETGGVLVGDEIKLNIEVQALQQA